VLITLGLAVVALLMFVSEHLLVLLLAFGAALTAYGTAVLARGGLDDVEGCATGYGPSARVVAKLSSGPAAVTSWRSWPSRQTG
jgi:hypothetical protein